MVRVSLLCLGLPVVVACTSDVTSVEVGITRLPDRLIQFSASPASVSVFIQYQPQALGACALLLPSFHASVGDTEMTIVERGAYTTPGFVDCRVPRLSLDHPPLAAASTLTLQDASGTLTIDLKDLLAPRSAQPVPPGPFTFTPGQVVTLRYAPASDLNVSVTTVNFEDDTPGKETLVALPISIAGELITMTMPGHVGTGTLSFLLAGSPVVPPSPADPAPPMAWPYGDATATYVPAARLLQPITIAQAVP